MKDKIIMFLVLASLVIDWDTTLRNFGSPSGDPQAQNVSHT